MTKITFTGEAFACVAMILAPGPSFHPISGHQSPSSTTLTAILAMASLKSFEFAPQVVQAENKPRSPPNDAGNNQAAVEGYIISRSRRSHPQTPQRSNLNRAMIACQSQRHALLQCLLFLGCVSYNLSASIMSEEEELLDQNAMKEYLRYRRKGEINKKNPPYSHYTDRVKE